MKLIIILNIVLLLESSTFLAIGDISIQDIKSKSDTDLTQLLNENDGATRCACLLALASRFRDPNSPAILAPAVAETASHSHEVPLPEGLLEKTIVLAKSDGDLQVSLAAVNALMNFKFHTNTTPALMLLLEDRRCLIRIRVAQALIGFKDEYHEAISDRVVQALIDCLDTNNSPDDLWQAAATLGGLGQQAKKALPLLEELETHSSPQVREYAKDAVLRIQK